MIVAGVDNVAIDFKVRPILELMFYIIQPQTA
jgi:hypothetical protein